jgi:hypothetical protein
VRRNASPTPPHRVARGGVWPRGRQRAGETCCARSQSPAKSSVSPHFFIPFKSLSPSELLLVARLRLSLVGVRLGFFFPEEGTKEDLFSGTLNQWFAAHFSPPVTSHAAWIANGSKSLRRRACRGVGEGFLNLLVRSRPLGDLERLGHARGTHARYLILRAVRLDHVFDDLRRDAGKVLQSTYKDEGNEK